MNNKSIIKENQQKRDNFVKSQPIQTIELAKIMITEPIHMNTKINFAKQIEKLKNKNITMLENPIIVQTIGNGYYSLVNGYKGYNIAKALEHEFIPAIVVNEDRKGFIKRLGFKRVSYVEMPLWRIEIPKEFMDYRVTKVKIQKVLAYYDQHKELDKPVTIKGDKLLVDGYSRYVAAKILKLDSIPVMFA